MERLPPEVILEIITRLPIRSLLQFRCVCKAWFTLAQDPYLLHNYQCRSTQISPCLILHSENTLHDKLHIIDEDHHNNQAFPSKPNLPINSAMPNFDITGSCNGFLCLTDTQVPDTTYIYNPFIGESIQLPPVIKHFTYQRVALGFGFDQVSKAYKVIRCVYSRAHRPFGIINSDISIHTLGTDSWRSLGKKPRHWLDWNSPTASVNGYLHWLTKAHKYKQSHDIVAFDFATEEFHEVPYPSCPSFKRNMYSLVELGGRLCAVVRVSYNGKVEVWVMKEYNMASSWSKDYILGEHAPVGLNLGLHLSDRMRNKWFSLKNVQVLCLMKTGEILIEYGRQAFACYDPEKAEFRDLNIHGLPNCFESVVLRGNILSLQDSIQIQI
ncbi:hypothetical protein Syun_026848 [Stephania yunnanensis]|uniref:F-box domain-containing protein n=1 Tax=Stephania yunnanensis TaxID=152371 RepID=A0AAP0EJK5_9MAGN